MVEILQDYFTIAIESRYNERKTKSGIILLNAAWIDDQDMDRYEHKRIYGEILSVPQVFSSQGYRAVDDGMPTYRKFVGHDDIVDRINRGYTNHNDKTYYPSTFDQYDVVTMADIAKQVDVKVGDRAYFMPQVTEDDNYLGKENGKEIYKVCVTDIFCVVRITNDKKGRLEWSGEISSEVDFIPDPKGDIVVSSPTILMQGEWVLVKPNMETWNEITTKSGIITKVAPDKKWLEGIVSYTRHNHMEPGDKIMYLPNADCEVTVEDEKYFVMPAQDIMGKF